MPRIQAALLPPPFSPPSLQKGTDFVDPELRIILPTSQKAGPRPAMVLVETPVLPASQLKDLEASVKMRQLVPGSSSKLP